MCVPRDGFLGVRPTLCCSLRRWQVLEARILEAGMPLEAYGGYLDLRKYGSVPHAGELVVFLHRFALVALVRPWLVWPVGAALRLLAWQLGEGGSAGGGARSLAACLTCLTCC